MDRAGIERFLDEVVAPAVYPRRVPLEISALHLHGEPVAFAEAVAVQSARFGPFEVGNPWGAMWDTTWFRFTATVPDGWRYPVALVHLGGADIVGFSAEGLVWDRSGTPLQGLHHEHREVRLPGGQAAPGSVVDFFVEAAANPTPRWHRKEWPELRPDYNGQPLYALEQAELADADREVEALRVDMAVLLQLSARLPARTAEIVEALAAACDILDPADISSTSPAARAHLQPMLGRGSASTHRVTAVGHAHIDSAWLWPVRETRRKCARTFANQLRLMEGYPEHRFACSQAAQYEWIRDSYPALYEQIRGRVAEGRWEPVGGMWVEADTNLPSGESLVRQLVHGKRFFSEEFGVETHELWIPDVFGYSAALPQIATQAGVTALVTQKMSWNDTNRFPHSTFWWEGHDGSRLLAHFPPANTYNGSFTVAEVTGSEDNNQDRIRSDRSLYPFGYGDGGGGPNATMLETARRLGDVEGLPKVEIASVASFLDAALGAPGLDTWVGELYLEAHRGTFTTHADVKLANRRGEEALRAAEMWSVAAGLDRRAELDRAWKLLLFNQFHDIIPGSSIAWVYDDTAVDHAAVLRVAGEVISESHTAIAAGAAGPGAGPGAGNGSGRVVFNASSYPRTEIVDVDGIAQLVTVPACGWAPAAPARAAPALVAAAPVAPAPVVGAHGRMENEFLRVTWDSHGLLISVIDLVAGREVLAPGERGNLFQLHADNPRAFDAWDVDREYLDHVEDITEAETVDLVEAGPLRSELRTVRTFGRSRIVQTMRLVAGSRRLEFHTDVDWHEDHKFLKVAFAVAVRSARATYEIQHGHVERPTVANTSWDEARFEVCAHRWADISEPGYGVALLNDCKYGYDIRGHTMRLSLLRAPGYPDPTADRGRHRFVYALFPHAGDFREAGVVEEAESLNLPLTVVAGTVAGGSVAGGAGQVVAVDRRGVSIEAVKWADRGGGVIVRLCEVWGSRGPARVRLNVPFAFTRVERVDLLERSLEELEMEPDHATVVLQLRPFELATLRYS